MSTDSVITIDCQYVRPEHAAAYLVIEGKRAAFVDNNTVHAAPLLLKALNDHGLAPEDVEYVIPTHLHLDHSGATSLLVKECSNATVLAHPRAVRHLIDPSRLIASAKAVYGEADFERLYAPISPVSAERIRGVDDGGILRFGERTFTFLHTRGHANHHICIHDSKSNGVFTGDAFGVEYRSGRESKRPFLICSSSPTDFDPIAARESVRRIVETGAERVFLAHYGELKDVRGGADAMFESVDRLEVVLHKAIASGAEGEELSRLCEDGVESAFRIQVESCGAVFENNLEEIIKHFVRVNAQGVALLAQKCREKNLQI
jgi:glyoxylase-like metal-dependent hydrolase (beta-lactamase superfamily II)